MDTRKLEPAGMDADDTDTTNSNHLYRFRYGSYVLYVEIEPHCILVESNDNYGFPLAIRKLLPETIPISHNLVRITSSGKITSCNYSFKEVQTIWHLNKVDVATLLVLRQLTSAVFKVKLGSDFAIAKIARFDFEICYIEAETRAYRDLDGQDITPKFLGHLTENRRTMGMLIEYLNDFRMASKQDLAPCTATLTHLHGLGYIHGDINRHNFLIRRDGQVAKVIDLDFCVAAVDEEVVEEMRKVSVALNDEGYRGAPREGQDRIESEYTLGI